MHDEKNNVLDTHPPLKNITHEALHDLVHFDTKLFKTLPVLLFKPGMLTQKALTKDGDAYVKPFALFVFLNFVFFIVKFKGLFAYRLSSYSGIFADKIKTIGSREHIPITILTERFNTAMHFEQKEYLIIMVPLFALLVQLLFIAQRRHYFRHLIFALHFYSFFIVFLIVVPCLFLLLNLLLAHFNVQISFFNSEDFLTGLLLSVNFIYLLFAVKRFYLNNWLLSIIKSAILSYGVLLLIVYVFRTLLFFIVIHTAIDV